ncbi:MAG: hypothetical protein JWO09_2028 [Bacteroidetes bacterium]|nr:hypothetical protein [Bacteroidota bacterium]
MTEEELKYLVDVQIFIDELIEIVGDNKRFEKFDSNLIVRRAIERQFELIGEAIKNFKKTNTETEISHSKEIIGLRNRIVHAYDSIDYATLWGIIINHIPKLKAEIEEMIKKNDI